MTKGRLLIAVVLLFWAAAVGSAQTGLGGLRGVIVDDQGAVLPGVTVAATSPSMLGPQTAREPRSTAARVWPFWPEQL